MCLVHSVVLLCLTVVKGSATAWALVTEQLAVRYYVMRYDSAADWAQDDSAADWPQDDSAADWAQDDSAADWV